MSELYITPEQLVEDIVNTYIMNDVNSMLEPAAGTGQIVRVIRKNRFEFPITAIEVNPNHFPEDLKSECKYLNKQYTQLSKDDIGTFDLIFTNPPFPQFDAYLKHSVELLNPNGKIVFLMPVTMLTGIKRGILLKKYRPSRVYLINDRPKFQGNDCGNFGFAWVVWENADMADEDFGSTILLWI